METYTHTPCVRNVRTARRACSLLFIYSWRGATVEDASVQIRFHVYVYVWVILTRIHGGALILEAESALALSFSSDPPIIRIPESGSELMFVPHGKNRCVRPCGMCSRAPAVFISAVY